MNNALKLIGAILLLVGTAVGAGMLALPMVTAEAGIYAAIAFMIVMYFVMLVPAFYILEVLETQPRGAHLASMAKATLGMPGLILLWVSNCCLLYAILAAYIAGGGKLLFDALEHIHLDIPLGMSHLLFTIIMAMFVVSGVAVTTTMNGILMILKALFYFILVLGIFSHISVAEPVWTNIPALKSTVLVGVAAFTYAMILPSLYAFLNYNPRKIKIALIVGSAITLIVYILWLLAVLLVVPLDGPDSLHAIAKSQSVYKLSSAISTHSSFSDAPFFVDAFTSICLLTTFLGISLCLSDVIADGLKLKKEGASAIIVYSLTYLPPLLLVFFFHKVFIGGIRYAGLSAILYIFTLPCLMVYSARYKKHMIPKGAFKTTGGKPFVLFMTFLSVAFFIYGIFHV